MAVASQSDLRLNDEAVDIEGRERVHRNLWPEESGERESGVEQREK